MVTPSAGPAAFPPPWTPLRSSSGWAERCQRWGQRVRQQSGRGIAQTSQPGPGLQELGVPGATHNVRLDSVGTRIRAQETHLGADPLQPHQCLADPLVVDVALAVDREAIVPEPTPVGARLDPGQVDATGGELLKEFKQATGVILMLEQHDRGLVSTS